ncbi:hypothetical protein H4R35_006378 [Dimargaris xerosporica]|nr:hypothetical protein H4R35_006378 [Dimargaris xerosporica]
MERQGFTLTIVNWFILDTATAPAISIPTKHPLLSLRPNITLYSLWDYTQAELEVTEYESTMAVPLERIASFLQIPWCLEKLLFIGSVVCLDSFLHAFTILPTQIAMAFRMRDILDMLLSKASIFPHHAYDYVQPALTSPGFCVIIAVVYMFVHSMILFYYIVALNVTINLYIYSLLTLLLSNQFADIKSNVFKWFDKENVIQICSSDIIKRF